MDGISLDHLVYGGPDLDAAVARVRGLTGLDPVRGGRHLEQGTANYMLGLGSDAYLEILGPDPEAPTPAGPRWFGLEELTSPRLLTWAVRPDDLDSCVVGARASGYDPGDARRMSRQTEDGTLLSWRLTGDTVRTYGGIVPFLIDWADTARPSALGLPSLDLVSLSGHASPEVQHAVAAIGADALISWDEKAGLRAELNTPRGRASLA